MDERETVDPSQARTSTERAGWVRPLAAALAGLVVLAASLLMSSDGYVGRLLVEHPWSAAAAATIFLVAVRWPGPALAASVLVTALLTVVSLGFLLFLWPAVLLGALGSVVGLLLRQRR